MSSTSTENPETQVQENIPKVYSDFYEVFSKAKVTGLPPHRPYDCAIDLLPGTTPPRGQVYPLSVAEQWAIEEYVDEALRLCYLTCISMILLCGKKRKEVPDAELIIVV